MAEEIVSSVSYITDRYVAYPGESLHFSVRVQANRLPEGVLVVLLPRELELETYEVDRGDVHRETFVSDSPEGTQIAWRLPANDAQAEFNLEIVTVLQHPGQELYMEYLVSNAFLYDADGQEYGTESVRIMVKTQGNYMNFLPEIYRKDDLMGRFLMLFESFWKPIEQQIRQVSCYFDPDLTPESMLPWLASWVGAYWDEYLPVDRQRLLLRTAVSHYQRRGTRYALEEFLKVYSNGEVEVTEHPARNLVLSEDARMGRRIALGKGNSPHTFSVDVKMPLDSFNIPETMDEKTIEHVFRQKLNAMITLHKPAHTDHQLSLELIKSN